MNIKKIDINKLNPATYNPRKDLQKDDAEYIKLKRSIETFGYVEPVIINTDFTVIGGHQRLKVLKDLNFEKVDCVVVDVDKTKEKALNVALNKISGEWDMELLKDLMQDLKDEDFDMELTGFDFDELNDLLENEINVLENSSENEEMYSKKTEAPTYEPKKDEAPEINVLVNELKTNELIIKIQNSNINNDIKQFLILSAYRHLVFNYENIAEFYCHQSKETQELMEDLALVIIDFKKAIQNGYVELTKNIAEAYENEYKQ
jgi:hypothetical protein